MGISTNTQPLLQPNFTNTYSPANMGISTNTHPLQSPGNYNIIRSHQSNLPTGMRGAIAPGNETVETVIMEYLGVKIRGRQHLLSHIMDPQVFFGKPRSRAFARRLLAPKAREPNSTVTTDDASTSKASEEDQWTSDLDAEEDSDSLVRKMKQLEQRVRLRAPRSSNKTRGITKATRPLSGQLSHNHRGMLGRACQRIQTDEEEKRRNVTEMGQGDINSILQKMQAGVSVNMSDSSGRTPLHVACIGRNATTVYMLLHMGAPVNVVDNLGNTPLTLAAISLSISIVLLLLEAGADPRLGNGLVKVVTMLRSRINLMRANIQSSLDNERRYFVLDDNTRSRMRESRSRAAHVIIECLKIVTLLGALARKADSSSPCPYAQYESARSEASEPAILSAEAAGQLDELSSLFNSLDLVPSQTTSPTQQSSATSNNENAASDHIQTTNNADSSSLKENEVDTKMVELLDKFALLLGEDSSKS
ncbi:hypothetical protein H4S08_004320 [Coemansia sp. RSA 1365]|nr:hypothetical protein H4S08_004320 [Coemansia sp. RSA 1365]